MTKKERFAIILDFLKHGYPDDDRPEHQKTSIAQAVGKDKFTLLELVPKKDMHVNPHEEVYIGSGKREKIHHVNKRIGREKLTEKAKTILEDVIEEVDVVEAVKRFLDDAPDDLRVEKKYWKDDELVIQFNYNVPLPDKHEVEKGLSKVGIDVFIKNHQIRGK